MKEKIERIKELVALLNKAGESYYSKSTEIMSNYEYDQQYDELVRLEADTGYVQSDSPTVRVGYEALGEIPKERHERPMLSLDKTKEPQALAAWLGDQKGVLSWKLDGLTVVLTYENGALEKAVTRGNGEVGEVITNNARVFKKLPLNIPCRGRLIVRGEAVIRYSDFERINEEIEDESLKYKNPRNLCSASARQLNNEVTARRNVNFFAFALVEAAGMDFENSRMRQFEWLKEQGFAVVEHAEVTKVNLQDAIDRFEKKIPHIDLPSDGLVIALEDIAYGASLGRTAKFPRDAMAFKWLDETKETTLLEIEWSPSRTGLINPIAIFEPVELEGTSVSRASVHNISVMENLKLGLGDTIEVYKANMIIPQIAANLTGSGGIPIPQCCPVCGGPVTVQCQNEVKALFCPNPACQAKHVKAFEHFAARDAMNIEGLSEATLEKFIQKGMLSHFADIFRLSRHQQEITSMEGLGKKSFDNLMKSIENARKTTLPRLLYSIGIENIGLANAKMIAGAAGYDADALLELDREALLEIDGVGYVIADSFISYFKNPDNREHFAALLKEVELQTGPVAQEQVLAGKTFVVTGALTQFENRDQLKSFIERLGGKVTGSVTGKTDFLINNDALSQSSKNKTAAKLGVPVITEEEFLSRYGKVGV